MNLDLQKIPCFGVAGNFTGHLEQAGEAKDFLNVNAAEGAPKALFPTYIPLNSESDSAAPDYLKIFPFDSSRISAPAGEKIQTEPECAIICQVEWKDGKAVKLIPEFFGASNDCSIRKEGAKKISMKKNWGAASKGLSENLLSVDSFSENGIMQDYKIASFIVRDGQLIQYGEDSYIKDYSYIYEQLCNWILEKLNYQEDEGPAENVSSYLKAAGYPSRIMVSIGATRYTDFGEKNYLNSSDLSVVVLYPASKYNFKDVMKKIEQKDFSDKEISFLVQEVYL